MNRAETEEERSGLWRILDRVATVAVIATCAALVTVAVRGGWGPPAPEPRPAPAVGDRLVGIEGLELDAYEQTLFVVVSSRCRFCTESMPFYRRLLERRRKDRTQVVVASAESVAVTAAYLAEHGVEADRVLEVSPVELRIRGTPTLLELSRSGEIRDVIVGRVPDDRAVELAGRLLPAGRGS